MNGTALPSFSRSSRYENASLSSCNSDSALKGERLYICFGVRRSFLLKVRSIKSPFFSRHVNVVFDPEMLDLEGVL